MASMTFIDYGQASSRAFMGDISDRNHLMPGGGQLAVAGSWSGLTNNLVPSGTIVGRTNAEKLSGADFGPADDADDEMFIVHDETSVATGADRVTNLVRHGSQIKYDFLASWAGASTAVKNKLHASYNIVKG